MASNLLKEAIADAKAVRETAIANAKLALEEAFTPRLQSMLSNKIEEELDNEDSTEEEDVNPVEEQSDSSKIGSGDNKVDQADGDDEEKSETEKQSAALGAEGEDTTVDKLTENEGEEEDEEAVTEGEDEEEELEEQDDDETDAELEEIIRELEGEEDEETEYTEEDELEAPAEEETTEEDELEAPAEDEATEEDEMEAPAEDEEEDLNIESILKALKEEGEDEEEEEVAEVYKEQLKEAYDTIRSLKSTLTEVNLLNAKLLFSNKLFKSQSLTESQKMRVIETFDRAHSLREVKLVYTTLAESLKSPVKTTAKKLRTEGLASKAQKTTKPKTVIAEGNDMASRMKKLAGLL